MIGRFLLCPSKADKNESAKGMLETEDEMQVGSIDSSYGSLWDYKYKNALESAAGARSQDFVDRIAETNTEDDGTQLSALNGVDDVDTDPFSFEAKLRSEKEYEAALAEAKENDIEKYYAMLAQKEQDVGKSFRQLEKEALSNGDSGTATYKGVAINFDAKNMALTVGDVSNGNVIHVGRLSNGYSFSFNRDNLDSVIKILDLFSPSDVNKILEAITKDNIVANMEGEVDELMAASPETAEEAVEAQQKQAEQDAGIDRAAILSQDEAVQKLFAAESGTVTASADAGGAADGGESKEEEKEVTSEIVVNADGTRNLLITTRVGDESVTVKMPLSPLPEHDEYHRKKGAEAYEEQLYVGAGIGSLEDIESA